MQEASQVYNSPGNEVLGVVLGFLVFAFDMLIFCYSTSSLCSQCSHQQETSSGLACLESRQHAIFNPAQ